jgi:hypothetical protein
MIETLVKNDKAAIVRALYNWIGQRPGLEFGNYGNVSDYRSEMRSITRDLHEAQTLVSYIEMSAITGDQLAEALKHGFSGRLSWDGCLSKLDYCTGQYWPTEYRKAVCAVCAAAIWVYFRDGMEGDNVADRIRKSACNRFGRSIGSRWFR